MQLRKGQGLYIISVAAQILEMHPQTLRKYERVGFIEPPRLGTLRLYSEDDIARLRLIKYLVDELGLNLSGVQLALRLASNLLSLRKTLDSGKGLPEDGKKSLEAVDRMLKDLGITVVNREAVREEAEQAPTATSQSETPSKVGFRS
jgi:MerR family transcriptional regulator/heat shock protein HspR